MTDEELEEFKKELLGLSESAKYALHVSFMINAAGQQLFQDTTFRIDQPLNQNVIELVRQDFAKAARVLPEAVTILSFQRLPYKEKEV